MIQDARFMMQDKERK